MAKKAKTLHIKLVRSVIGTPETHRRVVTSLGLHKTNSVVEHDDTPVIRGMINKISYLLEVTEK